MFSKYANDPNDNCGAQRIGPNGMFRLINDLQLDATDRRVLILACKLKAQTQCEFSKEEWDQGVSAMGVDSVSTLRKKLDQLDASLTERAFFRELYNFTFVYGKPAGQRNMDLESALAYWRILFKDLFPLLDLWEEFLVKEHKTGISKDDWIELLDFCYNVKADLSNYDDDGAWPLIIDLFVNYARKKQNEDNSAATRAA